MTPAVDEGLPKELALLTMEDELEVENDEVVGDERMVDEVGETVAAPEEEKVKV